MSVTDDIPSGFVCLFAACVEETERALLVEIDGVRGWVPKSMIHEDSEVKKRHDEGDMVFKEFIAQDRGFI